MTSICSYYDQSDFWPSGTDAFRWGRFHSRLKDRHLRRNKQKLGQAIRNTVIEYVFSTEGFLENVIVLISWVTNYSLNLVRNFRFNLRNYLIAMATFSAKFTYRLNYSKTRGCKRNLSHMILKDNQMVNS